MPIKRFFNPSEPGRPQRAAEMLRFALVGTAAVLIQYAIYALLVCAIDHNLAMSVGYGVSFVFNFLASTRFTFRVERTMKRGAGFALSHTVNWLLQLAVLNLFLRLGLSKTLAPLPMFAICVPVNFVMVRFFLKQNGVRIFALFQLRREEFAPVALFSGLLLLLHALLIARYWTLFTPLRAEYGTIFIRHFHLSGFDPITYSVISEWSAGYNVYRHPLLAFLVYPLSLLNQGLMQLTGINCAVFLTAALLLFCALYSFVFLHRLLRDVLSLRLADARLLSAFFFSLAYVLLSAIAPDHFLLSLFLLLLTLYLSGLYLRQRAPLPTVTTLLLFILTAGVSLNNGLKVFLAALFTRGRGFFRPHFLLLAVLLPAALLWQFSRFEYRQFVWAGEVARHEARAKQKAVRQRQLPTLQRQSPPPKTAPKMGMPMMQGEFMRWTDMSTPRLSSTVENLFGESFQLHRDHLLEDLFGTRPVIVPYRCVVNYVVEALLVLLFLAGVVCGRYNRLLQLALSFALLDWALHLGLGFGLNEVYIMTVHWAYVVPLALACLFMRLRGGSLRLLRVLVLLLTIWLYGWNLSALVSYLLPA